MSDCLVLMIQEREDFGNNEIDNTLYVFYDVYEERYYLRGHRQSSKKVEFTPYSFGCSNGKVLLEFISRVICTQNKWTYTLYNFNDLPMDSNEITYEYLHYIQHKSCEVYGYDDCAYVKKDVADVLRSLKHIVNYY
jgi:hypothetical protein